MKKNNLDNSIPIILISLMIICIFIVSIIFKIQIKNKSDILINTTKSEDIKDPEHNIDIYIGYLIDAPKKDLSDSKYGYSYRSILNTYYKDSKWTYYDNSDNTKIDATAQFDGYDNMGNFKATFRFLHNNNEEFSTSEIHAYLNGDEKLGMKHLKNLIS